MEPIQGGADEAEALSRIRRRGRVWLVALMMLGPMVLCLGLFEGTWLLYGLGIAIVVGGVGQWRVARSLSCPRCGHAFGRWAFAGGPILGRFSQRWRCPDCGLREGSI